MSSNKRVRGLGASAAAAAAASRNVNAEGIQVTNHNEAYRRDQNVRPPSFIFTSNLDDGWPKCTRELCLYDLQPFECKPVGIPRGYDEKRNMYRMQGLFCSWSCAFAYLQREKSSPKYRIHLNLFRKFIESVLNMKADELQLPPPLEHLAQLAAARGSIAKATTEWRSSLCAYADLRPVDNLFLPVSQVFEERTQRDRIVIQQDMQAERMSAARPKPLVQTREAQRLQGKLIKEKKKEKTMKRNAIDELLGVKLHKRPKSGGSRSGSSLFGGGK